MPPIQGNWKNALNDQFKQPYYRNLFKRLEEEYRTHIIFPPGDEIFSAFHATDLEDVKVVILGQDPYHGPGQAHGMCFSVKEGVKPPPSLVNIFQELQDDIGAPVPESGCLIKWARQGVFLLNTVLTVRIHEANSHRGLGWEEFTDAVIRVLDNQDRPMVFFLWGSPAQKKMSLLHNKKHLILKAPHPSPLSAYRGFFGSKPFSKANEYFIKNGVNPIDWTL